MSEERKPSFLRELLNSAVPENVRLYVDYMAHNMFATAPQEVNEDQFSKDVLKVVDTAVQNARKKGKSSVGYDDYPPLANGLAAEAFVTNTQGMRDKQYPGGWETIPSLIKLGIDSYDPVMAAVTSLGAFDFKEAPDGTVNVMDKYDFGKIRETTGEGDAYRKVREAAGTDEKVAIPVNISYNSSEFRVPLPSPRPAQGGVLDGMAQQMSKLFGPSEASAAEPIKETGPSVPLPTPRPQRG
jgi:hypothetical protein